MDIRLYSTAGCHLCEQAKVILWPLLERYRFRLVEIDIASDDSLIEQYGIRIPVLSAGNTANELDWPFTSESVAQFFESLSVKV